MPFIPHPKWQNVNKDYWLFTNEISVVVLLSADRAIIFCDLNGDICIKATARVTARVEVGDRVSNRMSFVQEQNDNGGGEADAGIEDSKTTAAASTAEA